MIKNYLISVYTAVSIKESNIVTHSTNKVNGAVYKINGSDCHASYIGETGRN